MTHSELIDEIRKKSLSGSKSVHPYWINVPAIYPVIRAHRLNTIEIENGLQLPLLLKRIYSEIGNGGQNLGPQLMGIACKDDPRRDPPDNETRGDQDDCLDYYSWFGGITIDDEQYSVLPFCDWGCNMWSCIVLNNNSFPVYFHDGAKAEYDEEEDKDILDNCWELEADTIEEWFEKWVKGIKINRFV